MSGESIVLMRASLRVACCALTIVGASGLVVEGAHADDSGVRAKTQQVTHAIRDQAHRAGQDVKHAGREIGAGATKFGRKVADKAKSAGKDIAHGVRQGGAEVKKAAKKTARAVKGDADSRN